MVFRCAGGGVGWVRSFDPATGIPGGGLVGPVFRVCLSGEEAGEDDGSLGEDYGAVAFWEAEAG